MATKIGIVLALDGEQKFAAGMRAAQTSAKTLKQQLSLLQREYKDNANNIAALSKKQEALKAAQEGYQRVLTAAKTGQANAKKAYKEQADAVEKLSKQYEEAKKALDKMRSEGQEGTDAYQKQRAEVEALGKAVDQQTANYLKAEARLSSWDGKVAQAESDLREANDALSQNEKYLEEASKSADGCATSIDRFGNEVDEAGDELKEANGEFSNFGNFLSHMAANLAADALKKLGEVAVDAAKYVIEVGSGFEASMSKVQALSGASTTELEQMESVAKQLGSSTKFSAQEVADGFSYMALAGWNAQQSIDAIPGIVNLAAASEMDLAEASDMVTDYLSAFGMEASEAGKMADMIAHAQANSNTSTRQLGDAFGNCAANMHAAGQDMETTTSFLEAFANQGVKGSEAGTKLAAIMRDITAKMKDGAIQIGDTAVAVTDADGNFRDLTDIMIDVEAATDGMGTAERSAALAATFTSRSVGGLNMILAEGMDKISGYEEDLRNCDGAASDMASAMQNNLSGKLTEFNSALEGLGIQLYGYFSGPLSNIVSTATKLISGITEAIKPQKSEIDGLVSTVKENNKQIDALMDKSDQALTDALTQVGSIDSAAEILRGFNEQYGLFLESDPSETSSTISESLGTIEESAHDATGEMKNLTDSNLDTLDSTSSTQSSKIGEALGKIQTASEDAKGAIDGAAGLDNADLTGLEESASTTSESIGESLGGVGTLTEETKGKLGEMRDLYIETADQIRMKEIDPVALVRVNNAIETLKSNGVDLSQYWDEENGRLNISLTQFNAMIDKRKNAIIQSAIDEIEATEQASLLKAEANKRFAESTVKAAQKAMDAAATAAGATKTGDGGWVIQDAWGANVEFKFSGVEGFEKIQGDVDAANAELANANAAFDEASAHAATMDGVIADLRKEYKYLGDDAGEAGAATGDLGDQASATGGDLEDLGEDAQAAGEAVAKYSVDAAKAAEDAYKNAGQAIKDAVAEAKEAAEQAFSINPFEGWKVDETHGMQSFADAMASQITSMQNYATNLQTVSDHVGKEITPEFLQYLQDMGQDGAQLLQEIADAFENGDTQAVQDMVNQYTEALDAQDTISNIMAMNALAYKLGIKEFGSSGEEWKEVEISLERSIEGTDATLESDLYSLINTAKALGVKIPDGLSEAIEQSEADPEQALKDMIKILSSAISGQQHAVIEAAREAGVQIPSELVRGLSSGGEEASQAWAQIVALIAGTEVDTSGFQQTGEQAVQEFAEGTENSSGEAESAAQSVGQAAQQAISTAVESFSSAGTLAGVSFRTGLNNYGEQINSAANARASAAAAAAGSHSGEFSAAGSSMGSAFKSGVESVDTTSAGSALANGVVSGLGSINAYDEGKSVGSDIGSGINQGISDWIGTIKQTAVNAVNEAVAGAKAAADIHSPSKVFEKEVGYWIGAGIALGITNSTDLVVSAAQEQMSHALANLSKYVIEHRSDFEKVGINWREAIAIGWQQIAKNEMIRGFGIAKTKTEGSGDQAKEVKKTAEEYATDVLNAAKGYFENVKKLYDVTSEEEVEFWKNVRSNLKVGTQAWFEATGNYRTAQKRLQDEQKAAQEEQKRIAEEEREAEKERQREEKERLKQEQEYLAQHDARMLERAEKYIEHKKILNDVEIDAEIDYWQKIAKRMKQGSDEWYEVQDKLNKLREQKAREQAQEAAKQQAEIDKQAAYDAGSDQRMLQRAEKFLDRKKTLQKVSLKYEEEYWTKIQKRMTKGSDEWYSVQKKINTIREQRARNEADAAAKEKAAQQQAEQNAAQHDSRLLTNAEKYMKNKKVLNDVSVSEEIKYWTRILARMKEGSDEWYTVYEKLGSLREQRTREQQQSYTNILNAAEKYVSRMKTLNKMNVSDEARYWEEVRKQLKRGSDEWYSATEKMLSAKANIGSTSVANSMLDTFQVYNKMSLRAEVQYWAEVRKHYKKGTDERVAADRAYYQARQTYYDNLNQLTENYNAKQKELEDKRASEIADKEKELAERIKSINDQLSKDIEDANKKRLDDIQAQQDRYISAVKSRKEDIMGAFDIFSEFESSSVSGHDLLFNMQSQAAGYKDWAKAIEQLQKRGILSDALMDEIRKRGPQDSAAVHALMSLTDAQLKQYQQAYSSKEAIAQAQAEKENTELLRETNEEIKKIEATYKEEIKKLKEDARASRKSETDRIKGEISDIKNAYKKQLSDLKTTYTNERKELTAGIDKDFLELAKNIRTIASDQVSAIINGLSGKSTSPSISNVKTAKKNAVGAKQLKDFFAWMDELGIGSEMIVRKSDGARLNTNVRPGDAIIPAKNTDTLWKWSEIDPSVLINGLKAQQASLNQYITTVMSGVASLASLNARALGSGGTSGGSDPATQLMAQMFALMQEYMPFIAERQTIEMDGRALVGATAGYMSEELAMRSRRQRA